MASNVEDDAARLRLIVVRIARHLRAIDASSALTPTQASLFSTVVRRGPLGLTALSELEGVAAPSLSRAVARLERQGLVRRRPDPSDGRAVIVEATPAGTRLMRELRAARDDALRVRLSELDEAERRLLHAALPVLETVADDLKRSRLQA